MHQPTCFLTVNSDVVGAVPEPATFEMFGVPAFYAAIFMIVPAFLVPDVSGILRKVGIAPVVADLPHATVVMRDGTRLSGTLAARGRACPRRRKP